MFLSTALTGTYQKLDFFKGGSGVSSQDIAYRIIVEAANFTNAQYALLKLDASNENMYNVGHTEKQLRADLSVQGVALLDYPQVYGSQHSNKKIDPTRNRL
ncbi:hypothetical protein JCGZ_08585 [Jatropha curcas]|uniref:Uncharacterized protein n=1 Tax=Jatropha curcas TaxID=180498 RepID=A0A067KW04_JATCU|nr:hypothetical protein JCGZ_08585 [Jatropha curcas]